MKNLIRGGNARWLMLIVLAVLLLGFGTDAMAQLSEATDVTVLKDNAKISASAAGAIAKWIAFAFGLIILIIGIGKILNEQARQRGIGGIILMIVVGVALMSPTLITEFFSRSTIGTQAEALDELDLD